LSQPIGLHATPRPNARLFDLASDELATFRAVVPLVGPEVGQHHILLQPSVAPDLPHAMGDRIRLQQILLNLLLDAVEAMREASPVRRRMVVRAITDHRDAGPLGDRLHRECRLRRGRSIMDSHRGRLWATANPDHGGTFHVA
jgi:signal transduction histidine kinase